MGSNVPVRQWILVPAIITLAVTLLRLVGELQGWSPALFNPAAGGGGALVGISWLIIVFGIYFGYKLGKGGHLPSSLWKPVVIFAVGFVVLAAAFMGMTAIGMNLGIVFILFGILCWVFIIWFKRAWPEAGSVLLAYALAARIPVTLLMLFAIYGEWGTHYDVLPPDAPEDLISAGPLYRWFAIGFVPQMTVWIYATVIGGGLLATITAGLVGRRN